MLCTISKNDYFEPEREYEYEYEYMYVYKYEYERILEVDNA